MAWLVVKEVENKAKTGFRMLFVESRATKGDGYDYKFSIGSKRAKVFYNEESANEWAADAEGTKVITYDSRGELKTKARLGIKRGEYDMSKYYERKETKKPLTS